MYYTVIALLAAIVLVIINHDILRINNEEEGLVAPKTHRLFLLTILVYFIIDALWGVFDSMHLGILLMADTTIYFVVMALSVFFWTRYVIAYLEREDVFAKILFYVGRLLLIFVIGCLAVNLFVPVFFWFEEDGTYHTSIIRYITLGVQTLMFLYASIFTFAAAGKSDGAMKRRYLAIGTFGAVMIIAIGIQFYYPLWPIYSIGCLVGTCVLHSFVVESEKREYRKKLEEVIRREQQQEAKLGSTRALAYTDSLTGVKSTHAYSEHIDVIDHQIDDGEVEEFAVVVFDLNDLKLINDTMGHEAGDEAIIAACKLICKSYAHSPVFRIGGDEFVAILEGLDYQNRIKLLAKFDQTIEEHISSGEVVVAAGMAEYGPLNDNDFHAVFERADMKMYLRKQSLKGMMARS